MKKSLSLILAMVMILSCLSACSNVGKSSGGASAGADGLSGTLAFLSGETDDEQVLVHKEIIAEFEKLHPGVKIDLVLSGFDDREEKILADLYAGAAVDVIQVDPEGIGAYVKAGILYPLDSLIKSIGEADFIDGSRVVSDGHDYAMPYAGFSMMMYARKDLIQAAGLAMPTTWDELLNVAKALTRDGMFGMCLPAGQNNATALWLNMFINMAGGTLFNEKLEPTLNTEPVVKALTFYKDLAQYCPQGITSYGYGDQISSFCAGQVAMSIYQGRMISRVASGAPDLVDKYAVIPVPTTGDLDIQLGGFTYYSVGANCKNPQLALAFLEYLTTGDRAVRVAMSAAGHIAPALHSVNDLLKKHVDSADDAFLKVNADFIKYSYNHASSPNIFYEVLNAGGIKGNAFERNGIMNTNYSYIRQNNILSNMVQRVLIEGADPNKVCEDAQKDLVEIIKNNA